MPRDVKGKIVLITGSADGLGLAMVDNFLKNDAKLAIMLDFNEKKGLESVAAMKAKYGKDRAVFYTCNVVTDLEKIFEEVIKLGYIDVVINNAGVLDEKNIKKTMNVNAIAVMEWTMKFFEYMRNDKGGNGGTIINISSIYGYRVTAHIPYYHGSKFAVIGFSKSIGHEYNYNRTGVRVVTFCPGLTKTNMANNPNVREEDTFDDFALELNTCYEWQSADDIGRGMVETFKQADTGSVWLVEGGRPAEKINV
ncbi:15-hydroxyprostaglandin dehydrogenase [NAD(+)]-like [Pieris rapae]|uniref:15-hydroxyprostaglandin dehydrogenase [NAD(+)]-like n=1 Tax=Pieris rapae TaxID=64459 RepID=UPI001E27E559|nr:15-hydroxyprostaglandin dehydrogenase [NAD(+)]-like [Pieris rapae]